MSLDGKVKKTKRSRSDAPVDAESTPVTEKNSEITSLDPSEPAEDAPARESSTSGAKKAVPANDELPELVGLSHKEKRLAKRRKLAGIEPEEAETSATAEKAHVPTIGETRNGLLPAPGSGIAVGNTPGKGAHGIWIGNLNFATSSKQLLAWLEDRGLREVTRINMPAGKRSHEVNRGFAYIDFPSAADVEIAVGLSENHLDGRKLLIKSSSDYSGRPTATTILPANLPPSALVDPSSSTSDAHADPASTTPSTAPASGRTILSEGPQGQTLNRQARKILDRQKNPPGPTLFLGNLGFETKAEDIRQMFDAHQKAAAAWTPGGNKKKAEKGKATEKSEEAESDQYSDQDETEGDKKDENDDDDSDKDSDAEAETAAASKPKRFRLKKSAGEEKKPLDLSKAETAGIRKIRLGTFEDTGKCKGWAFVDFHLPEQCTRALLNIRNHSMDGRALNVEYASSDAVRRGGIGTRAASGTSSRGRGGSAAARGGGRIGAGASVKKGKDWDDQDIRESAASQNYEEATEENSTVTSSSRGGRGGAKFSSAAGSRGGRESKGRAKPGAALASAQRASEAIVASTGRKITFD